MAQKSVLKSLFSSQTRVKLLATFLLQPDQEFFIRELTRLLDEQINSIRRELENLRKIGFVKARHKNRKKFYKIDTDFIFYQELRSMFTKEIQAETPLVSSLKKMSEVKLVLLTGSFVGADSTVDLLVVGNVKKEYIEALIAQDPELKDIKYSIFPEPDFLYRVSLADRFVHEILTNPRNLIVHNNLQDQIDEAMQKGSSQ
jgi:predicted transcriptional regulator